jgi:glutamyl-Q tRNA(Asp) synthetase
MPGNSLHYTGRFAPSPTGPLHFGSLVAATASYCDARAQGGRWLLRMEDLDAPRCSRAAAGDILRTLEAFGFDWDGEVMWQSDRAASYAAALERLRQTALAFACGCSRKEIADSALPSAGEFVYPGTCRNGLPPGRGARSWRVRVDDAVVDFTDRVQGAVHQDLAAQVGDFVLRRADGYFAYQLAVVVDDAEQGITDVVRGADLLDSTPRQIHLQRLLGFPRPRYAHVPVAVNPSGEKLSKQTLAPALRASRAAQSLASALRLLGQHTPPGLETEPPAAILAWGASHWRLESVPRRRILSTPPLFESDARKPEGE